MSINNGAETNARGFIQMLKVRKQKRRVLGKSARFKRKAPGVLPNAPGLREKRPVFCQTRSV